MPELTLSARIDALLQGPAFANAQAKKEEALLGLLREICAEQAQNCQYYGLFLRRLKANPETWRALADIPPLPVSMFKRFELKSIAQENVVRELRSSSTTGQQPSRIFLDKATAFRQSRALVSVLKDYLGTERRPYLVLDAEESVKAGGELTARGAAIRGVGGFASETVFALKLHPTGELEPNWVAVNAFFEKHGSQKILMFGFTFIVWTRFIQEALKQGFQWNAPHIQLLHSGGWKKLESQSVTKDEFGRKTAGVLGCAPESILDFYGMIEQVGTVFVDCSAGNKHAPTFSDVIIRRPGSLKAVAIGESGIIEVLSALPTSYPGNALITEDEGVLCGIDDCPCGRSGQYFRFQKRIERAEVRGCGDTFAQNREARR